MKILAFIFLSLLAGQLSAQESVQNSETSDSKPILVIPPAAEVPSNPPSAVEHPFSSPRQQEASARSQQHQRSVQFFVGVYHSGANSLEFSNINVKSNSGSGTGTMSLGVDSVPGITVGVERLPEESWGFIGSLNVDKVRNINSSKITLNGSTAVGTYTGDKSQLRMFTLDMSFAYCWKSVYLPFGLNVSAPTITQPQGSTGVIFADSGVGAQLGIGFRPVEYLGVEIYSKSRSTRMTAVSGVYSYDFGIGTLTGIDMLIKFGF